MELRSVNAAGLALLLAVEGCRLYTYDDATGLRLAAGEKASGAVTAGVGHTGPDVTIGMAVTQEAADRWRDRDMALAAADVQHLVTVALSNNQFAALCVFRFNIGPGNFRASTLLKRLNAGAYTTVPMELARWNVVTVDGRRIVSKGLTARRAREAALFSTPDDDQPVAVSIEPAAPPVPRLWRSLTAGGAVLAGMSLPLSAELQNAAGQIQPLLDYSRYIHGAFIGLSLSGVALSLYGRLAIMKRHGV